MLHGQIGKETEVYIRGESKSEKKKIEGRDRVSAKTFKRSVCGQQVVCGQQEVYG